MSKKYDQYGDVSAQKLCQHVSDLADSYVSPQKYAQQDSHELLRHLLDSIRMEEVDVSFQGFFTEVSTRLTLSYLTGHHAASSSCAQAEPEKDPPSRRHPSNVRFGIHRIHCIHRA
jgi:hypothetical protein